MTTCCSWPFHSIRRNMLNQSASSLHAAICWSRSADVCLWLTSLNTAQSVDWARCSKWNLACNIYQQHSSTPFCYHYRNGLDIPIICSWIIRSLNLSHREQTALELPISATVRQPLSNTMTIYTSLTNSAFLPCWSRWRYSCTSWRKPHLDQM